MMKDPKQEKIILRKAIKGLLILLTANKEEKKKKDQAIFTQIDALLKNISPPQELALGVYYPTPGEIPIDTHVKKLFPQAKILYPAPIPQKDRHMNFHWDDPSHFMATPEFGKKILCPRPDSPILIPHIVFVPALAYDKFGHRLGMGKGYYDEYISRTKNNPPPLPRPVFIGICYLEQFFDNIPVEGHDFWVHYVVSENFYRKI